jgi:BarA-like signal transduction histidine kinase
MGQAHHDMIRLSLDIPAEQHMHLKMMATKKGMSMREYILEALAFKEAAEEEEVIEIDNTSFRKGLKRIRKEHSQLAKNLSKR